MSRTTVKVFFNFRSPYCYLASRAMFDRLAAFDVDLEWRSLGGWDGRSAPDRAKVKVPLTRQDVKRWCKRVGVPFNPPPMTTDPTPAAMLCFAAEEAGCLADYVKAVMWQEWAEGSDIGKTDVLLAVAGKVGIAENTARAALDSAANAGRLTTNWKEATALGVIGVPTFVVGEEIFWGNDRIDFLEEHLAELGLRRG
ncbi:MAG: DsbA family protein [Gammaproteobacteria bacterium]